MLKSPQMRLPGNINSPFPSGTSTRGWRTRERQMFLSSPIMRLNKPCLLRSKSNRRYFPTLISGIVFSPRSLLRLYSHEQGTFSLSANSWIVYIPNARFNKAGSVSDIPAIAFTGFLRNSSNSFELKVLSKIMPDPKKKCLSTVRE